MACGSIILLIILGFIGIGTGILFLFIVNYKELEKYGLTDSMTHGQNFPSDLSSYDNYTNAKFKFYMGVGSSLLGGIFISFKI